MTLTEFLLARIAEDEERAQFVARQIEGNNWTPFEEWKLSWHDEYDLLCIEPSRALAECEAKRRIVEEERWKPPPNMECDGHPGSYMPHGDYGYGYCMEPATRDGESSWTLRHLAAVYADHPDYQEEWKP